MFSAFGYARTRSRGRLRTEALTFALALVLGLGVTACDDDDPLAPEPDDIVETAVAADGFETLVAALQAADLVETLKGDGPFTVFAPTDQAFARLPAGALDELLLPENRDQLVSVLAYHVVPGRLVAEDVVGSTSLTTVQGGVLSVIVEGGQVSVGGARVVQTDILASNGVIHVIDGVLLPQ